MVATPEKAIGQPIARVDAVERVKGRAVYAPDLTLPGTLHCKILRSPYAHARIKSIDTSAAESYPGVKGVVTHKDLPSLDSDEQVGGEVTLDAVYLRQFLMAQDRVLFHGHPVAAVAATSPHIAEEALDLIKVDYEPLPAVVEIEDAIKDDAPIIHEEVRTRGLEGRSDTPTNISVHMELARGDVAKGYEEADVVLEGEYRIGMVHQGYIEPQACTVDVDATGHITIYTTTQATFANKSQNAALLQVPLNKVNVVPLEIGGGFGGKFPTYMEPAAAIMSHKTGQPVKMIMSRTEVFQGTGPAPGSYMKIKMGAKNDGTITAAHCYMAYEAGAYPGSAVGAGAQCILAPYYIANVTIDAYDVVVNKPKSSAYRAPGAPNAAFASESVIDELAEKIDMDPLAMRLQNSAKEGTRRADGTVYRQIGCEETVQAAKDSEHYHSKLEGPYRGRGVAGGFWFNGGGMSSAAIAVNDNGTINLTEGSVDIGGTRAAMAMIVAETLGLRAEDINPSIPDTSSIGFTGGTGGSRVCYATGHACYNAAEDVKAEMCRRAALQLEVAEDDVEFEDGSFVCKSDPTQRLTFAEVAANQGSTGGPITGKGTINAGGPGNAFAVHIVDVEIDPDTGKVEILRYTAVQDVGKAVHPSYVEGQIQGGAVQGIGWALTEGYFYTDDGQMANPTFLDYRMPTTFDIPLIETILVEVPNPASPHGIRGVGEVPLVPPMAAIANAIYDAIGCRLGELPMSPDRVVAALQEHQLEVAAG
jgi:CO/xanthine dehydrogenase Mo-binding subunit